MATKTKTNKRGRKPSFPGKKTSTFACAVPTASLNSFKRWAKKNGMRFNEAVAHAFDTIPGGN